MKSMWDSIFVLIHHLDRPFKKKDLHYLLNSRIKDEKKDIIFFHDIHIQDKCSACKEFEPWIILKNSGEGLFLIQKMVNKFSPWITMAVQENLYDLTHKSDETYDFIFVLINNIKSPEELYELLNKNTDNILDADIRIKNKCIECKNIYPWLTVKYNKKGMNLLQDLSDKFEPFITLKKSKTIYKHNIPEEVNVRRWTREMRLKYGDLKIKKVY